MPEINSNPIQILHAEHEMMLNAVKTAGEVQKIKDNKQYRWLIHDVILFFRNYSEIFHYPKEEQILFPVIKSRSKEINDKFLYELGDNHDDFKALMAEIENFFESHDYPMLRKSIENYLSDLTRHIGREEKEILHISANLLDDTEIQDINEEFLLLDGKLGEKEKENLEKIISNINSQLSKSGK